jgi:hypothetical protein
MLSQMAVEESKYSVGWNGALEFATTGNSFGSKLLDFDFKFIVPKKCFKTKELDEQTKLLFDSKFESLLSELRKMTPDVCKTNFETLFRYMFYSRVFRETGKASRLGFYYLFERLYNEYPQTCCSMLKLLPEYGYFGDLNYLMEHINKPDVINSGTDVFINHLNSDCMLVFGKMLKDVTKEDIQYVKDSNLKVNNLSLASKWLKRENKQNSKYRNYIIEKVYNITLNKSNTMNYYQMMLRKVTSLLSKYIDVVEQKMCSNRFSEINMSHIPSNAMTKYVKALANEKLDEPVGSDDEDTGNRYPDNIDRIQARKNLLETILNKEINGITVDIRRMADSVMKDLNNINLSNMKRKTVSAQFNAMVSKLKEKIDSIVSDNSIDPRDVIGMVDVSGSMVSANVLNIAVMLGIIGAHLSNNFNGLLMTFTDNPKIVKLDMSGKSDIYDHFKQIMEGPVGYSTNLQACFDMLLDVTKQSNIKSTSVGIVMYTDCQINEIAKVDGNNQYYDKLYEKTIVGYVGNKYKEAGYDVPRLVFWNLNGMTPGFPAGGTSLGIQMVSGYSQSLMNQVFSGKFTYENNVVKVDPLETLLKVLYSKHYDKVTNELNTYL